MSWGTNQLHCNNSERYPIEHAMKALFIMQDMEEFDDICELLKKRLIDMFNEMPIKNEEKRYGRFHYQKNGIAYLKSTSGYKEIEVILEPWGDIEDENSQKDSGCRQDYNQLRGINYLWWNQLRTKLGRRYLIYSDSYIDYDFKVHEIMDKYKTYLNLTDEEKQYLDYDTMISSFKHDIKNHFYLMTGIYDLGHEKSKITFLTDEGLQAIIDLYNSFDWKTDRYDYRITNSIDKFLKEMPKEYIIDTGIDLNDMLCERKKPKDGHYYTYHDSYHDRDLNFEGFINVFYPKLYAVAEEYEHIKKFLIKTGVFSRAKTKTVKPEDIKIEKKEEGTQDGGEQFTEPECCNEGFVITRERNSDGNIVISAEYEVV